MGLKKQVSDAVGGSWNLTSSGHTAPPTGQFAGAFICKMAVLTTASIDVVMITMMIIIIIIYCTYNNTCNNNLE